MHQIITRADVARKLREWQSGVVTTPEIAAWAESLYANSNIEYTDWEGNQDLSATNEVLARFDFLAGNLILPEDVPIYLRLLEASPGSLSSALVRFDSELSSIDYLARRERLRSVAPYKAFIEEGAA